MTAKIGFVGAGYIARRHRDAFADLGLGDTIVGVTDPNEVAAASFGSPVFADLEQMLRDVGPDAVFVCVPPHRHGRVEEQLVAARTPFFVEKPLAADVEAARRIEAAVRASGLPTAVGYHWRQLTGVHRLVERVSSADASRIVAIGQWVDGLPGSPWWRRQETSGGQMVEQVTHLVDVLRLVLGDVRDVEGMATSRPTADAEALGGDVPSGSAALLGFSSGALATLVATYGYSRRYAVQLQFVLDGEVHTISEEGATIDKDGARTELPEQGDPFTSQVKDVLAMLLGEASGRLVDYSQALQTHEIACRIAASCRRAR